MEAEIENLLSIFSEEDIDWTGTYTWRVENWSDITEDIIYSPEFEICGYSWRLIVYLRGNKLHGSEDHIAVYLDFTEASYTPSKMCPETKFELMALMSPGLGYTLKSKTEHTFTISESGWDFSDFLSIQELQDPLNGYLVNDTFTLRLYLHLQITDIVSMTSKSKTGFVGIEGAKTTSLLSSYVQSLFCKGS